MAYKEPTDQVGEDFQRLTKYDRETIRSRTPLWEDQSQAYKRYPDAEVTALPEPEKTAGRPLWETIAGRRTFREFSGKSMKSGYCRTTSLGLPGDYRPGFRFRAAERTLGRGAVPGRNLCGAQRG